MHQRLCSKNAVNYQSQLWTYYLSDRKAKMVPSLVPLSTVRVNQNRLDLLRVYWQGRLIRQAGHLSRQDSCMDL